MPTYRAIDYRSLYQTLTGSTLRQKTPFSQSKRGRFDCLVDDDLTMKQVALSYMHVYIHTHRHTLPHT